MDKQTARYKVYNIYIYINYKTQHACLLFQIQSQVPLHVRHLCLNEPLQLSGTGLQRQVVGPAQLLRRSTCEVENEDLFC